MKKCLVVVDMQNDFVDGSLGTAEAKSIIQNVVNKVKSYDGEIVYTMDTHGENYLQTQEGTKLPVKHCIKGSNGFQIIDELQPYLNKENRFIKKNIFEKETFGSMSLAEELKKISEEIKGFDEIQLIGLCTDICVISNALLIKAALPEVRLVVDSSCCAGVSVQSHNNALNAMAVCQIEII